MKVHEMVEWLSSFEDQDAEVMVIEYSEGREWMGDAVRIVNFDPNYHTDYEDLRNNKFITPDKPYFGRRTLLLGSSMDN